MTTGLTAHLVVKRSDAFGIEIDLDLACGRTVALLGPNGAGKSTAVGALAGLLPIDDGRVVLDGRVLDDPVAGVYVPPEDRGIGIVFQDYLLFPHLTVLDNVAFGLRSSGESRQTSRSRAGDWIARFGLEEFAAYKPGQLSGGQAQRVALARALAIEPALLLLDEPLAALDVTTRAQLRRELADHLAGFAGPRLIITHDPTEAFLLADLIYVVEAGVVTQIGTPDDIRLRPATPYIADLAGSNLIAGSAKSGTVSVGLHQVTVADTNIDGPVLATIHPRAISLHRSRPVGSPRNSWQTQIVRIEHYGDRVRLQTGEPLPLTVELTPGAVNEMNLQIDDMVWVSIKATEVGIASQ